VAQELVDCIKDAPEIFKEQIEAAMAKARLDKSHYETCASNVTIGERLSQFMRKLTARRQGLSETP